MTLPNLRPAKVLVVAALTFLLSAPVFGQADTSGRADSLLQRAVLLYQRADTTSLRTALLLLDSVPPRSGAFPRAHMLRALAAFSYSVLLADAAGQSGRCELAKEARRFLEIAQMNIPGGFTPPSLVAHLKAAPERSREMETLLQQSCGFENSAQLSNWR